MQKHIFIHANEYTYVWVYVYKYKKNIRPSEDGFIFVNVNHVGF